MRSVTDIQQMACGIIPGNKSSSFETWDIPLRAERQDPSPDLILSALNRLDVGPDATAAILDSISHGNSGSHWPAFVDLLGMWSDWLPLDGSRITSVCSPIGHRIFTMMEVYEARVVWRWHLQQAYTRSPYFQSPLSEQMQKVLEYYNTWEAKYDRRFYHYSRLLGNKSSDGEQVRFFKDIFDATTDYFIAMARRYSDHYERRGNTTFYVDLICSHIIVNSHSLKEADSKINAGQHRNDGRVGVHLWDTLFVERAFIYADNVPKVIDGMEKLGYPRTDIEDAWWMLVIRGQAWEMGINRIDDKSMIVPSNYYNSPTRVYIL